jgi:hypothetical protein
MNTYDKIISETEGSVAMYGTGDNAGSFSVLDLGHCRPFLGQSSTSSQSQPLLQLGFVEPVRVPRTQCQPAETH